jgi:uncharacterized membrane protein YesL
MTRAHGPRQFGEGPLSAVAALVYTVLVIDALFVVASLPGVIPLSFLAPDLSNIPLAAACAIPVGPALSAAIYALHHRRRDITDLRPFRQFWHGYRLNWRSVLPVWVIGLIWLTIVGVTLANFWASGVPRWWGALLALIGVLAVLWLVNAVVVASLFDFRTLDVVRLAWELISRAPLSVLGNAGVLAAAVVVGNLVGEVAVFALGAVVILALVGTSRPMVRLVTDAYTEPTVPEGPQ